jgi:predicted nucleic acid-binding protein
LHLLKTDTEDARESVPLILRHSLNATDALHLRMACKLSSFVATMGAQMVLVAADKRLLHAAKAEGLS